MAEAEWILLNPGPANTTMTVRRALVMPDLCHREPEFFQIMRSCRERLVLPAGGNAFRVSNMGTLTPQDMKAVVDAFAGSLEEIGAAAAPRRG